MTPSEGSEKQTLQTVDRALSFLEFVANSHPAPKVREIADGLSLNISTTYHLLNTLEGRGYVSRDESGAVSLGAAAAVLYRAMANDLAQGPNLQEIVERLAETTQETAYLTALVGSRVVIQALAEGPQTVRVAGHHVGYSGSEHVRASGKAVLAQLSEPELESYLALVADGLSKSEERALLDSLAEIRRDGFAVDDEDYEPGVCCVAAPYYRADGHVAGSIAVSAPANRFSKSMGDLTAAVDEATQAVSHLLGHDEGRSSAVSPR